jgi:hypothetical protein
MISEYGVTNGRMFSCVRGLLADMRAPMTRNSLRACSIDAPDARRPKILIRGPVPGCSVAPFARSGIQRRWLYGKPNASGITPTIVAVSVPTFTVLPNTDGSLSKRVFHTRSPMTVTSGSAGLSSRSTSVRPSRGGVPIS